MGLGGGFPQPAVFSPASSGSPQPVGVSLGFPQAAVPLSTVGLVGEVPPQPDGPTDTDEIHKVFFTLSQQISTQMTFHSCYFCS